MKVDSEGVGRVSNVFSPQEVTEFKAIARKPDIYDIITKVRSKLSSSSVVFLLT